MAICPDGRSLATADLGRRIAIWREGAVAAAFDPLAFWERFPPSRRVQAMAFSPDCSILYVALTDRLSAYDAGTTRKLWQYRGPRIHAFLSNTPTAIAVNPRTGDVAASFEDGHLGVWTAEGQKKDDWFDNDAPNRFGYTRDGARLIGSDGFSVCVWDVASHAKIAKLHPGDKIYSLALSPIADVAAYRTLHDVSIWNVETGHALGRFEVGAGLPLMAFSPSSAHLAVSERDRIAILDFEGRLIGEADLDGVRTLSLAFAANGSLFVGCADGAVRSFTVSPRP
jgi:WD40 repeat protein